jgi:D-xylose transport system substrate-binding protein
VVGFGLSPGALQRILVRTQCLTVAPSASAQAAATLAAVVRLVNFQRVSGSRVVRRPGGRSTVVVAVHGARLVRFPDVRSVIAAGAVPRAAVCTPAYQAACTQAGI